MKVTYNRGDLYSTCEAALKLARQFGRTYYVLATGCGFTIAHEEPPFHESHIAITKEWHECRHWNALTQSWQAQDHISHAA